MSRRSNGLIGTWAEAQRQQQRQQEMQRRAQAQNQREQERQRRAHERALAQSERERQAAYRQHRDEDARQRTAELEARVQALTNLLASGCRAPAFRTACLTHSEQIEAFSPGQLASPVPMPDPSQYQAQVGGWTLGTSRRARAEEEARARFEHDWHVAQAAETYRQQQLADYRQQYDRWAHARLAEIRRHNAGIMEMAAALRNGDPEAVVQYFSAALYASAAWPEGLPRQVSAGYDSAARQLVLNWEMPRYEVVPETKSVRYMPTADQDKETARPAAQRRSQYRDILAQCVLLTLRELFGADEFGVLDSVALNGFVDDNDPATGRRAQVFLATVMATRSAFSTLNLELVNAVDCLVDGLRGQLSARPDQRAAVRPGRLPSNVGSGVASHGGDDEEPDLYEMDPIEFESLVAELFRAMGMQAVTTQRSNDGGVDVDAVDPTPIRGGKIVVQVKRYRNTVPPTAVRDLYGTVQSVGANKGVLVTTSGFGPGSHNFANGKPLELVSGAELVDLLHRHGLRGRRGDAGHGAAPQHAAPHVPDPGGDDHYVLGMSWSGDVALDVCAMVCCGNRVLSDDHFVFFNNPRTPDGSVCTVADNSHDKAAIRVAFDAIPRAADRLVLVAAIDPSVNPQADLAGFTDASIRLLDTTGAEVDRLSVSDGRPGETALVLGSFRRRASSDWEFVAGGKGYTGGLGSMIQEYGVTVS
ncbi:MULTISPECIES: restriction endonuclease [Streptacidiphilus]|uniref:Restriction endonuclease n=1 Tax=Streptacidiphilus cavernicola TaxID=3342716 RepID=A0ABV6URD3_9ACTN|nr:restriction endonuclease [Streptacidiphilus jeojiense]